MKRLLRINRKVYCVEMEFISMRALKIEEQDKTLQKLNLTYLLLAVCFVGRSSDPPNCES
jgi:hypothetical protein